MTPDHHSVLIVEDDPVIRKFLQLAITQTPQLCVVATADSAGTGIKALQERDPAILVVDLTLPDGSGVDLIREARRHKPPVECMVVTMHDDYEHLFQALHAGATGYLLKDALPDNIGHAVLDLLSGGSPVSPAIARTLLRRISSDAPRNIPPLTQPMTKRELDVLRMMAEGLLRQAIAERLHVSINTINTHIRNIYRKLEVRSNTAAIHKARQLGILTK